MDWKIAIKPTQSLGQTQSIKVVQALERQMNEQHVLTNTELFNTFSKFIFIVNDGNWFNIRIKDNPEFNYKQIKPNVF